MKDGRPVRINNIAVQTAESEGAGKREQNTQPHRPTVMDRGDGNEDSRKTDHRPDRQIKLTCYHEQAGADGDDHELSGNRAPVQNTVCGKHA